MGKSKSISSQRKKKEKKDKKHKKEKKKQQRLSKSRSVSQPKEQKERRKKDKKQKKHKDRSKSKQLSKSRERSRDNIDKVFSQKKEEKKEEKREEKKDQKKEQKREEKRQQRRQDRREQKRDERRFDRKQDKRDQRRQQRRDDRRDDRRDERDRRDDRKQDRRGDKRQQKKEVVREDRRKQRQPSPVNKAKQQQEDRLRKIAMRQVRARLMKFNVQQDSDDSQEEVKPPPLPIAQKPVAVQPVATITQKKKESKWGKVSSSEPSYNPPNQAQIAQNLVPKKSDINLSLELEPSQDRLKLSEDRSLDMDDDHHDQPAPQLQKIQQQQIDPLDQYMMDIQEQAAPQFELALKPKANIISYQDIVTGETPLTSILPQEQEEKADQFRLKFFQAIGKLQQTKIYNLTDHRGVLMENNEENKEAMEQFEQQREPQLDFFAKQRKLAERKELGHVDHSKITYQQVRFNLYRQAEQVKNYNPKDVQRYRKEAGDIKVRGKDVLNPVFNWYHCGFSDKVLSIIEKRQYKKPFPIQAQSMPLLLSGRDVIGIAQTGSGKTLAYLLPMIKHIQDQRKVQEGQGPIGLIMTPTRQLARQVYLQAKTFGKQLGIRVIAVYGGQSVQTQLSDLRQGAELIVCTPGRMIDILTLNKGKITNLKRVTFMVIDEADRMFDLGFEPQITRILENVRPVRQIALFSATFPKNVETLARRGLNKPVEIIVGSKGKACANVEQVVEVREQTSKFLRLLQILGIWNDKGSILIFVDKQTEGDYLFQQLLKYGYQSLVLHGAMDPDDREFTIYDFKKRVFNIMIATSVCARGLDIPSIVLVVNFKCPNHLQDYIHRIGRTGRGGNRGTAITFITPQEEQYSIDLLKALQMAQIHPPQQLIKLSQNYLAKVKKGQARRIRNRNLMGSGFKFDEDEQQKVVQLKDMIKKQMKSQGLGFDDSDDDDIELKKKKEEDMRGRNYQERIAEVIKNPQIKNKLLNQAVKAVSQAIKDGSAITTQKLLQIAVGSMRESVTKYQAVNNANDGIEQVAKLINSFQTRTGEGADFFSYDFEINDYPLAARQKACNQQFLYGIQHQTNCSISLRGVFVEPGKKAQVGCRKLYLHIQGQNKYYVTQAYKQIKQVLEQSSYQTMHMGLAPGKYSL